MSRRYKILAIIYFIVLAVILIKTDNYSLISNNLEYVKCGNAAHIPKPVPQLTTVAYTLLIVATPLVLIVFSIITLVKAIMSGNIDDVSKAKGKLLKKVIYTAVIFLVAGLTRFIINRVTTNGEDKNTFAACMKCFLYYSNSACQTSDSGNPEDRTGTHRSQSNYSSGRTSDEAASDRAANKSNSNSSNGSTSISAGSFSGKQVHDAALFMIKKEGGVDSSGNPIYNNFGQCYELSNDETAITIGCGGWKGTEAQKLLKQIRSDFPDDFKKNDTAHISDALDHAPWGTYCVSRDSKEAKAIINIITSTGGKKVQDQMIEKNVRNYISEAETKGIKDKKSIFLYMNVRHVFGPTGVQELLDSSKPDYSFDKMSNNVLFIKKYNGLLGWTNRWKESIEYAKNNL